MEDSLKETVYNVCRILNTHSVEYLIVGGTAVTLHGFYRQSYDPSGKLMEKHDLDLWYNPTYPNYFKLLNALEELGQDVTEFRDEVAPNPKKSFFKLEKEDYNLDLLPEILGLSKFRTSFDIAAVSNIRDIEVRYLDYDDLIKSKDAVSRVKDAEDINQLKQKKRDPE